MASVEIDDVVHGNQMSTVTTLPIVTTIPNDCDYEIDVCSKEGEWFLRWTVLLITFSHYAPN